MLRKRGLSSSPSLPGLSTKMDGDVLLPDGLFDAEQLSRWPMGSWPHLIAIVSLEKL